MRGSALKKPSDFLKISNYGKNESRAFKDLYDAPGAISDFAGDLWNDVTGVTAGRAARDASRAQQDAIKYGIDIQNEQFQQSREDMMPWMEYGRQNLGTMADKMSYGYFDMPNEDLEGPAFNFNMQMDPGYQFRMDQSSKALRNAAAARGNRMSGGTMADLMDRQGQVASDEYGRAFGRQYGMYQDQYGRRQNEYTRRAANLSDQYNRLASAAGVGQSQANSLANLGQGYASNMGNMYNQMGAAQAGGIMGQANARMNSPFNQLLYQLPGLAASYYGGMG